MSFLKPPAFTAQIVWWHHRRAIQTVTVRRPSARLVLVLLLFWESVPIIRLHSSHDFCPRAGWNMQAVQRDSGKCSNNRLVHSDPPDDKITAVINRTSWLYMRDSAWVEFTSCSHNKHFNSISSAAGFRNVCVLLLPQRREDASFNYVRQPSLHLVCFHLPSSFRRRQTATWAKLALNIQHIM